LKVGERNDRGRALRCGSPERNGVQTMGSGRGTEDSKKVVLRSSWATHRISLFLR